MAAVLPAGCCASALTDPGQPLKDPTETWDDADDFYLSSHQLRRFAAIAAIAREAVAIVGIRTCGIYSLLDQKAFKHRDSMRVSIVTGGGSGIGAAVARRLAGRDECLMLHGQGADAAGLERLKAVALDCQRAGANVAWCIGDLANAGTASELVSATRAAFGSVDAIVHAAGFADRRDFTQLPRAGLERSFAVMASAFHELAATALPDLTRGSQGRVVAISSFVAHRFAPDATYPASSAAKAALEALVKCLAIELASSGATANVVMPGYTRKDAGLFGAWTSGAGNWPQRPIRSHDWPNPTRWQQRSPFCCRRRPGTSPEPCCRSMAA